MTKAELADTPKTPGSLEEALKAWRRPQVPVKGDVFTRD